MKNPLRRLTIRLLQRSRAARLVFVLMTWPFVYIHDLVDGVSNPGGGLNGLRWALDRNPPMPAGLEPKREPAQPARRTGDEYDFTED